MNVYIVAIKGLKHVRDVWHAGVYTTETEAQKHADYLNSKFYTRKAVVEKVTPLTTYTGKLTKKWKPVKEKKTKTINSAEE